MFSFFRSGKVREEPPLLRLTPRDGLTRHQLYEGALFMGGVGSGKSSTAQHLMRAYMASGAGMLILTAKVDDYVSIERLAEETGRLEDLRRFTTDGPHRLDFLNYTLASSPPGSAVTIASQLMQDLVDFSTRTSTMSNNEPFWPIAAARKIRMAMTVIYAAKGQCSVMDVYEYCTSMPTTKEEIATDDFRSSYCAKCLMEAHAKGLTPDLELAIDFTMEQAPRLSDRTAGCIDAYVINLLEKFVHGSVRDLVASGVTNLSPDDVLAGRIVVVDLPITKFRESGQFVQMVWKLLVQRAALRRVLTPESRDVALWADEAQFHALPSVDSMTQAVARSQRLVQVNITQNLPLLISVIKSREDTLAWLSNLQTKFIFANSDKDTNEYFSELLGSSRQLLMGGSTDTRPYSLMSDVMGIDPPHGNASFNEQWQPQVPPEFFAGGGLRKGGRENGYVVDCIVTQGGRVFSNRKSWLCCSFKQEF